LGGHLSSSFAKCSLFLVGFWMVASVLITSF
jgi:hypothetical protein